MKTSGNSRNIIGLIKEKQTFTRAICHLFSIAILNVVFSCSYYKVKEVEANDNSEKQDLITNFQQEQKYIVVHSGVTQYHLEKVEINKDEQILSGNLVSLNENHRHIKDRNVKIGKTYRYKKNKTDPLNEIHIYLTDSYSLEQGSNIEIPIIQVEKLAVIDINTGRSIINIVGSTLGVLSLALVILVLTKSSCPFIYSYDGENYVFNGELYPGNIIRNAQTFDFLKLENLCETNGFYKVKVSNELLEIQHTDLVELILIDHPYDTKVLLDPSGNPVILINPVLPQIATAENQSVLKLIQSKNDEKQFTFNSITNEQDYLSNLQLKFQKPIGTKTVNLNLTVKNSMWLDYVFGEFNEKFGSYYNSFQKQQQEASLENSKAWQESQHIPLFVYLKRNGDWILEEKIFSTGPMAFRDIGLNINVADIQTDHIDIKLETGFMFWEIDHAELSAQVATEIGVQSIPVYKAITEKGLEVSKLLAESDGQYLTQKNPGDFVNIFYLAPEIPNGNERSIFVKSKGYYNYIRNYEGIPEFTELLKFKRSGHFTIFSKDSFEKIYKSLEAENSEDYAL